MTYGQKDWSLTEQVKRALGWEAKKLFYKLYIPAGILLGVLLLIGLLPKAVCDFLRSHALGVVAVVNIGLVVFLMLGMVLPVVILVIPYKDRLNPYEQTGDLSEKARLLARLLLGISLFAAVILAMHLASALMEKFATESISWLHWNYTLGFWKMLITGGFVQPLAILWIFLRRLDRNQEYQYVRSFFLGELLSELIQAAAELAFLHFTPGKEPPVWLLEGVWYLVMLGSAGVLFRLSLDLSRAIFGDEA